MHVVIIGNGISGITAARTLRKKSGCDITVVSAESPYFFSRTALMYVYMGHMKFEHSQPYENSFWEKNRINLAHDRVENVDFQKKELNLQSGKSLNYDKLLIATGSKSNKFGWPGQDLKGVQGLYSYQDLKLLEENTHGPNTTASNQRVKHAVIIGGGLIGVELAEMLMTRNIRVTFLVREDRFWGNVLPKEESNLILHHLAEHGVKVKLNTELDSIMADDDGRVKEVRTKDGETIVCEIVGLTAGVSPNVEFLKETSLSIERGIIVNKKLETNIPDVYAAGDCVQFSEPPKGRRNIEQVWYTGRMMGEVAAQNILGEENEYSPGPWFNSAKFFDIEYQTYGMVSSELKDGEGMFYWECEEKKKCIKVIYNLSNEEFVGINSFGIRLRHEVFDRWLRQGQKADYIMQHFRDALFDPEFYKDEVPKIIKKYNSELNKDITARNSSWNRFNLSDK